MAENIYRFKNKLGCELVSMFSFTQPQKKSCFAVSVSNKNLLKPSEDLSNKKLS